ncbi:MAG: maleate isomerase [Gammaproteobacteria bacterium]|jgi:maleate isomerase
MPDVAAFRAKMATLIPSTNTLVESDFWRMAIPGVTFHAGRMYIPEPSLDSDDAFRKLLASVDTALEIALRDVMTCEPDYLAMGMSAPTFWGGAQGSYRFTERMRAQTGLGLSTGSDSCAAALNAYGAHKIAVLTPYQPVMREQIVRYFEDVGFNVVRYTDLLCPSATAIAQVGEERLRRELLALDGPDVEAIVQCGTNLSMVRLAQEAEGWLGKPVIAINAAILWHAYRASGFNDKLYGFGSLLSDY